MLVHRNYCTQIGRLAMAVAAVVSIVLIVETLVWARDR